MADIDDVEAPAVVAEVSPEEKPAEAKEAEPEHVTVTIGDEEPPPSEDEKAPEWVRELRKKYRESQTELRELKERQKTTDAPKADPGPKPTLKEHDYDEEAYQASLEKWYGRKQAIDEAEREKRKAATAEQDAWQQKVQNHGKLASELKVPDFEDVEALAKDALSVTQQGVILHGSENSALLVYALGRNPKKLKELASISDPVKFAFAVARLETQLKVQPRKQVPPPERRIEGGAPMPGSVDQQLERLEAEAERTGDRSKVIAYKRQMRK